MSSFAVLIKASLPIPCAPSWITFCSTTWLLYCPFITLWGKAAYNEWSAEGHKRCPLLVLYLMPQIEAYSYTVLWRKSQDKSCWISFPWNSPPFVFMSFRSTFLCLFLHFAFILNHLLLLNLTSLDKTLHPVSSCDLIQYDSWYWYNSI